MIYTYEMARQTACVYGVKKREKEGDLSINELS